MKKLFILLFPLFLALTSNVQAQISWTDNINDAVAVASRTGQLIFVDFWATWCGPCRQMDADVWSTEAVQHLKDRFVFAKVDIDFNRTDATKYNVKAIPAMVIIDIEENKYVEIVGYKDLTYMLNLMGSFPDNMKEVYGKIAEARENDDWEHHVSVGLAFVDYSRLVDNTSVRNGFVEAAQSHFNSAARKVRGDAVKEEMIEIYSLIAVMRYNPKRALKKLDKMHEESTGENEDLFNYAYGCGLIESGEPEQAKEYYDAISASGREDLIASLNDLMNRD